MSRTMSNEEMTQVLIEYRNGEVVDSLKFGAFYAECKERIKYHFNYFGLNQFMDKDDFLQEVMTKMLMNIDKFDEERAGFTTWFALICKSVASQHRKKEDTYRKYVMSVNEKNDKSERRLNLENVAKEQSVEATYLQDQAYTKLMKCIDELQDNYKGAIELVYIYGYKPAQAAEILGCKSADISNWLNRANKKLQKTMNIDDFSTLMKTGSVGFGLF